MRNEERAKEIPAQYSRNECIQLFGSLNSYTHTITNEHTNANAMLKSHQICVCSSQ